MPTYNVEVRFKGLCPFVPGADLEKGKKPAWMGSFLVNASNAHPEQFETMDLPAHRPFLRFRSSDLAGQAAAPQAQVLLPLSFEDVVFVPPPSTQKALTVSFEHNPLPAGPRPGPGQERLFNWVTRMSDVLPRSGRVDSDCFAVQPNESRIIARVHVDHGTLETDELGQVDKHIVVSQLGVGPRQQATARTILLTMPCDSGSPFRIKTRSWKETNPVVRELVFGEPAPGESLKIEVVNLCADELLMLRDARDATLERVFRPDSDFRWCYVLSNGVRSVLGRPVPTPLAPGKRELKSLRKAIQKLGGNASDASQCSPPRTDSASPSEVSTMQQVALSVG